MNTRVRRIWFFIALAIGLAFATIACKKKGWERKEVDYALVKVDTEHMNLRHDTVGEGRFMSKATFVLVDARNTHDADLEVTLGGELVDADGNVVGKLRPASLRVPQGRIRTFALIDTENDMRPSAVTARVRVAGAYVPNYSPPVRINDRAAIKEGNRVTVSATVHNTAERRVKAIIIASFWDDKGIPIERPFTPMILDGHTSHPAEFSAEGAAKGLIFVGEYVY